MKLYVRNDAWGWDALLLDAAAKVGLPTERFEHPQEVADSPETYAFLHMRHAPRFREGDKLTAEALHLKPQVTLIPSIYECRLYDDKIRQARGIGKWLPRTRFLTTYREAEEALSECAFPLVSKANGGAGSSNVRIVTSPDQARAEADAVFFGAGIPLHDNQIQQHYLLWQDFCPQNENDWRVIVIAHTYGIILKRFNRPELPFASGSGNFEPVTELTTEHRTMLDHTAAFAEEFDFTFVGVDIVRDRSGAFTILEMTAGWDMKGYTNCRFFERRGSEWYPMEQMGPDLFLLTAQAIAGGRFKRPRVQTC